MTRWRCKWLGVRKVHGMIDYPAKQGGVEK